MNTKETYTCFFNKEEIEHIRKTISLNCHYSDRVMNKLDDLFSFLFIGENDIIQIQSSLITPEQPELKQIQRLD